MDDRLVLLQSELDQHALHAVRAEDAHQVVLEGQVELGAALVALPAGAAAQLVVDAPALVALRADDVEAAGRPSLGLAEAGHLGTDGGLAAVTLGAGLHVRQLEFATRISTLPPSWMSVPRPAMFVATVIAPGTPASATM